jgi:predicted ABC-type ATPase
MREWKEIVVLGGPNGAGKTTAAKELLPGRIAIREFVNADEIARGLSPFNPEDAALAAARIMIERMRHLVDEGRSFAFETTCSGHGHAHFLRRCKEKGWRITLLYLWLPTPKDALARVARRVSAGGHGIPTEVVIRRYWAGLANLHGLYLPLADVAAIYDNSDAGRRPVAERTSDKNLIVHDKAIWTMMESMCP